jgi:hypothetical protein
MVIIVNMTNTIEYNEYKTGERNEAIVFSLRPFVAKFSSAVEGLIVTLVLVLSGVYMMSQNVSALESQVSMFEEMTLEERVDYVNSVSIRADNPELDNVLIAIELEDYEALATDSLREAYINDIKANVTTLTNSTLKPVEIVEIYYALQDPTNEVYAFNDDASDNIRDGWNMTINKAADSVFHENASVGNRLALRIAITVLPVGLIFTSVMILKKKFIIDEVYYEQITQETQKRKEAWEQK